MITSNMFQGYTCANYSLLIKWDTDISLHDSSLHDISLQTFRYCDISLHDISLQTFRYCDISLHDSLLHDTSLLISLVNSKHLSVIVYNDILAARMLLNRSCLPLLKFKGFPPSLIVEINRKQIHIS